MSESQSVTPRAPTSYGRCYWLVGPLKTGEKLSHPNNPTRHEEDSSISAILLMCVLVCVGVVVHLCRYIETIDSPLFILLHLQVGRSVLLVIGMGLMLWFFKKKNQWKRQGYLVMPPSHDSAPSSGDHHEAELQLSSKGIVVFGIGRVTLDVIYLIRTGGCLSVTLNPEENYINFFYHLIYVLFICIQVPFLLYFIRTTFKKCSYFRYVILYIFTVNICFWFISYIYGMRDMIRADHKVFDTNYTRLDPPIVHTGDIKHLLQCAYSVTSVHKLIRDVEPYFYAFSLEYSLLAAGMLYHIWSSMRDMDLKSTTEGDGTNDEKCCGKCATLRDCLKSIFSFGCLTCDKETNRSESRSRLLTDNSEYDRLKAESFGDEKQKKVTVNLFKRLKMMFCCRDATAPYNIQDTESRSNDANDYRSQQTDDHNDSNLTGSYSIDGQGQENNSVQNHTEVPSPTTQQISPGQRSSSQLDAAASSSHQEGARVSIDGASDIMAITPADYDQSVDRQETRSPVTREVKATVTCARSVSTVSMTRAEMVNSSKQYIKFGGIFFMIGMVLSILLISLASLLFHPKEEELVRSYTEFYVFEILWHTSGILCCLVGFSALKSHRCEQIPFREDATLLIISVNGSFLFICFGIIAAIGALSVDEYSLYPRSFPIFLLVERILNFVQIWLQVTFLISSLRYFPGEGKSIVNLQRVYSFLFACNFGTWILDSFFETQAVNLSPVQKHYFGAETWHLVTALTYPFAIFFRFHSFTVAYSIFSRFLHHRSDEFSTNSIVKAI